MAAPGPSLARPIAALLAALASAPAFAECPIDNLPCGEPVTLARYSLQCPHPYGDGSSTCSGDHPAGTFALVANDAGDVTDAFYRVRDLFVIEGLPAGTPITVLARFHVEGSTASGCGSSSRTRPEGFISAQLLHGTDQRSVTASSMDDPYQSPQFCTMPGTLNEVLDLTIAGAAGQPFELSALLYCNAKNGASTLQGTLGFGDLPAGARVTSCKGYVQGGPVSAIATTWGRLKTIYR
jgi:hypothetical protein